MSGNEEEDGLAAVYYENGRYIASRDKGSANLVTMAATMELAESLAQQYNEEERSMSEDAKSTKGKKKSTKKTAKATKKAKGPKTPKESTRQPRLEDKRLPTPGSVLKREYKGKEHVVKVTANGFLYNDKTYTALSGVAQAITGYARINGFAFFKKALEEKKAS